MQTQTQPRSVSTVPVVLEPMYLTATVNAREDSIVMSVYRSTIVEWTDSLFAPVLERLNSTCVRLLSKELHEDDAMMFGEATEYQFELYPECPGVHEPHDCAVIDIDTPRGGVVV